LRSYKARRILKMVKTILRMVSSLLLSLGKALARKSLRVTINKVDPYHIQAKFSSPEAAEVFWKTVSEAVWPLSERKDSNLMKMFEKRYEDYTASSKQSLSCLIDNKNFFKTY